MALNFESFQQPGEQVAMESETASSADEQKPAGSAADTRGKHRILAELKRVEQESSFLEVSFSSCFCFIFFFVFFFLFLLDCACFQLCFAL